MAGVLEIKPDIETAVAETPPEVSLEDLPEYLKTDPELAAGGSMALSITAVLFFLLAVLGPIAAMQFYLKPTSAATAEELAQTDGDLRRLDSQVEAEKQRGQVHEKRLQTIEKQILAPANDRNFDKTLRDVDRVAREVANGRGAEGGYVSLSALNLGDDGAVTLAGSVDSYLTLADLIDKLEASDYLKSVRFSGASAGGDSAKPSVPYSLSMKLEAPSAKDGAIVSPSPAN
jgi:Tfp pilus assembly protein PilN